MNDLNVELKESDRKKCLFIMQRQTLDTFLNNGALNIDQYLFSLRGLVTKMGISTEELEAWGELSALDRLFPR